MDGDIMMFMAARFDELLKKIEEMKLHIDDQLSDIKANISNPVEKELDDGDDCFSRHAIKGVDDFAALNKLCKNNMNGAVKKMKTFGTAKQFLMWIGSYDVYQHISAELFRGSYSFVYSALIAAFSVTGSKETLAAVKREINNTFYRAKSRVQDRNKRRSKRNQDKISNDFYDDSFNEESQDCANSLRSERLSNIESNDDLEHMIEKPPNIKQEEDSEPPDMCAADRLALVKHEMVSPELDVDPERITVMENRFDEVLDKMEELKLHIDGQLKEIKAKISSRDEVKGSHTEDTSSREDQVFKQRGIKTVDDLAALDKFCKNNLVDAVKKMKAFHDAKEFLMWIGSYDIYQHISAQTFRDSYCNIYHALLTAFSTKGSGPSASTVKKEINITFYRAKSRVLERGRKRRKPEKFDNTADSEKSFEIQEDTLDFDLENPMEAKEEDLNDEEDDEMMFDKGGTDDKELLGV